MAPSGASRCSWQEGLIFPPGCGGRPVGRRAAHRELFVNVRQATAYGRAERPRPRRLPRFRPLAVSCVASLQAQ